MVQASLKRRNDTSRKLEQAFAIADADGDGVLDKQEFVDVMTIPHVLGFLELLDLEIGEAQALFDIFDNGDACMEITEFVRGVMRLKGQSRTLDMIEMDNTIRRVMYLVENLDKKVERKFRDLKLPLAEKDG